MIINEIAYKQVPLSLLLEADPCEENVQQYIHKSKLYGVFDKNEVIAVCAILPLENAVFELMNIAVASNYQAKGIGINLLQHAIDEVKTLGATKLVVGTGTFGYQLTFYQRIGFRVHSVEQDYFLKNYTNPIFESGIQHKDRLVLELSF